MVATETFDLFAFFQVLCRVYEIADYFVYIKHSYVILLYS